MKFKACLFSILSLCLMNMTVAAFADYEIFVDHKGEKQKVIYDYYIPESSSDKSMPILICVGGLPVIDGRYTHSHPGECLMDEWQNFSKENQIAILGLGFLHNDEDWKNQESYQFPQVWSGQALLNILEILAEKYSLNQNELYLFGISAGAQFVTRVALMRPDMVKAVASHAAGGYDLPDKFIPTKFLLTVGELDNEGITRVEWAKYFVEGCKEKGISVDLRIIPKIGHWQTEGQNQMSRDFLKTILYNE